MNAFTVALGAFGALAAAAALGLAHRLRQAEASPLVSPDDGARALERDKLQLERDRLTLEQEKWADQAAGVRAQGRLLRAQADLQDIRLERERLKEWEEPPQKRRAGPMEPPPPPPGPVFNPNL